MISRHPLEASPHRHHVRPPEPARRPAQLPQGLPGRPSRHHHRGIGAECARLFANEGAKVIVSDIDAPKAKAVAESINSGGGKALAVPGDLLKDDYLKELVKKAAEFGGGKIHIIVNNAGFTYDGVIHKVSSSLPRPFPGL